MIVAIVANLAQNLEYFCGKLQDVVNSGANMEQTIDQAGMNLIARAAVTSTHSVAELMEAYRRMRIAAIEYLKRNQ